MKGYLKNQARQTLGHPLLSPVNKLFVPFFSGMGSVVMFHRVIPNAESGLCEELEVTAEHLEKIIQFFIKQQYEIISIEKAYEVMTGKVKLDKKFVVFTFDDGYVDNYTLAYPIFRKYQAPFTIYVTTSFPDKTAVIWWYALKELLKNRLELHFQYTGRIYRYELKTQSQEKLAYEEIRRLILSSDKKQQKKLFQSLFHPNGIDIYRFSHDLTMGWDQVSELAHSGLVTIGAHTTNHPNLRNLDAETVKKEMLDSKLRIESHTGMAVGHFAFPFGSAAEADEREFAIAEELGFKTSTTTRCGNIFPGHSRHIHCLPRITPSPYFLSAFPQLYASGFIPALRHKFKRVVTQ